MLISLKAGELWSPMMTSQVISSSVAMLPFIPFTRVSERVIRSLTSSGRREMGMIQVEHPESNIAVSMKVIP